MKKLLFAIFISFIFIVSLNASTVESSEGYIRNESNNYGVKKHWKVTNENIENIKRTPYVDASKKIYDSASSLTEEEKSELSSLIDGFINETKLDFVFVSIDTPYSNDKEMEDYASDFYDYNDFGINNEKYGGFIFLLNTYEQDKMYEIYAFGEAQFYYDISKSDALLDSIISYFKDGKYAEGVKQSIFKLKEYYSKGYDKDKYYIDENGDVKEYYQAPYILSVLSSGFVTLLTMLGLVKKNKMVTAASNADSYLEKESINITKKTDNFVSTVTTHHVITSSSSGGSHSSHGSSGGGHTGGGRHF